MVLDFDVVIGPDLLGTVVEDAIAVGAIPEVAKVEMDVVDCWMCRSFSSVMVI